MVDNQEHEDNQNYEQKIVRMPDGQLAKVIEDYLYKTDFYNALIVVLKDHNSRNLVQIGKNTGVRVETKKSLVTLLDQNEEIGKILDERLLKITKQPIVIEDTNINYQGLVLKPNMPKIMHIIFQFVAKKDYDQFYPLQKMLKDIENEFIPEFEKVLGVQITSQNCYQFIRLLRGLERSHLTFFDENIYIPSKDTKKVTGINENYGERNNLNSFVDMLDGHINLRYNTRIKPIKLSIAPFWATSPLNLLDDKGRF